MAPMIRAGLRWLWWCTLFVATLEVAARIDDRIRWGAPFVGRYAHEALITRDTVTLRGRPGYRFEKWRMNSHGFRGPELSGDSTKLRVVALGASETFGLFESEGEEYPAQLQRMLDSIVPGRYEVVNAGLPGMSLAAMRPYIRTVLAPLRPDVVLVYPTPSFFLEPSPPADSFTLPAWIPPAKPSVTQKVAHELAHPRLKEKSKAIIKRLLPAAVLLQLRERKLDRRRSAEPADWIWRSVPTERMDQFEEQLDRVVADLQSIGSTPILISHANRFLHRSGEWTVEDRQHLLAAVSSYWPRASEAVAVGVDSSANHRLRAIAQTRGIAVVDAELGIAADDEHFADYSHFTNQGARAMAKLVTSALILTSRP